MQLPGIVDAPGHNKTSLSSACVSPVGPRTGTEFDRALPRNTKKNRNSENSPDEHEGARTWASPDNTYRRLSTSHDDRRFTTTVCSQPILMPGSSAVSAARKAAANRRTGQKVYIREGQRRGPNTQESNPTFSRTLL